MRQQPNKKDLVTLLEFTWSVAPLGYEWKTEIGSEKRPGIGLKPDFDWGLLCEDAPVNPGLFVDFSQVEPNRKGTLDFAYWNGLLLSTDQPETQALWRHHIKRMKDAIALDRTGRAADRVQIAEIANHELRENTTYQLVPDNDGFLRPRCVPNNLLGAMWVQFATTADTDAQYEECDFCGRTMLLAPWLPGGRRNQAKYCGNSCRQRAKRTKAKAKKMLAEGVGRRRVARELDVTEKWLRERGL